MPIVTHMWSFDTNSENADMVVTVNVLNGVLSTSGPVLAEWDKWGYEVFRQKPKNPSAYPFSAVKEDGWRMFQPGSRWHDKETVY